MSSDLSEFHVTFFEESFEALDAMETELLELDLGEPDAERVNTIFRGAHSIKGGAGMFGFEELASFTHVMETLLDQVRDGKRSLDEETRDLLLRSVDCLRALTRAQQSGEGLTETGFRDVQAELNAVLEQGAEGETARSPNAPGEGSAGVALGDEPPSPPLAGYHIRFAPYPGMLRSGNEPSRMFRELAGLGELTVTLDERGLPDWDALEPEDCYLAWDLRLEGEISSAQVDEIFEWVEDECELVVEPLASTEPVRTATEERHARPPGTSSEAAGTDPTPARRSAERDPVGVGPKPGAGSTRRGAEPGSIRVGIDKVDALINLVGELVITQSMLSRFRGEFDAAQLADLQEGLSHLEHNTRELQESIMQIRMLPIKFTFSRFPRLVRDLCAKLGKKVDLQLLGERTELDKTVLEKIGDPLVHIVRNSLDHGVEMPEARRKAGKPETGRIVLNAFHEGGNIVIQVTDDGAGVDTERVLAKAIEQGIVEEGERLSEEAIVDLIFHPGFSTAESVSDVSGRGVGMDVVRRNIKELGGSVEIRSQRGLGSTLTIRLPLTLAILDGQLVRVGSETYIVPLVSIVESLQVQAARMNQLAGSREVYRVRAQHIPVIRLAEQFEIEAAGGSEGQGLLVVVETDGVQVGLMVDDLLDQQQVVIKSLEANFQQCDGFSGATILGDGTVALIIDVPGLVEQRLPRSKAERLTLVA